MAIETLFIGHCFDNGLERKELIVDSGDMNNDSEKCSCSTTPFLSVGELTLYV
jgi:hypothetical protein